MVDLFELTMSCCNAQIVYNKNILLLSASDNCLHKNYTICFLDSYMSV